MGPYLIIPRKYPGYLLSIVHELPELQVITGDIELLSDVLPVIVTLAGFRG